LFFKTKKGGNVVFVWHFYGRFLSINKARTARPTMITTNSPAIAGTKYMSATDVGVGVGVAVAAGAFIMLKVVSEDDGQ
jgi:divalent metal cation (Fe/Co/Zn/Cd) transporter